MNNMRMRGVMRKIGAALLALAILGAAVCVVGVTAFAGEVSSMTAQSATIKGDSVNTRSGAGTNYDKVEALTGGTQVTVTGQANDGDGTVWYQVTLPSGKTAFVRNDFLELGEVIEQEPAEPVEPEEPVEVEPAEPEEPAEPAPIVSDQYVALYEEDDTGTYYWYLHNNDDNYRVKIDDLLDAARSVDEVDAIEKQNKTLKLALIIMGVVLVILVIILIVLIFRLRDYMYYEEDEEDEDDEEDEPRRGSFFKRKRDEDLLEDEEEEEEPPSRSPRRQVGRDYAEEQATRQARPAPRGEGQRQPRQATPQQRPRESDQTRRARNIMREDDDMSFEFLNLDDEGNN